jgi:hypothetical protein
MQDSSHDFETPEKLSKISESMNESSSIKGYNLEESKSSLSPSKPLTTNKNKTNKNIPPRNSESITKSKSSAVPKKNNPVMDKMGTKAQEREHKRLEIVRKKQEQKLANETAKIEEEKQRVRLNLNTIM